MLANNIGIMLVGMVVGMLLYGISPQEGTFTAGARRTFLTT